MSFMVIVVGIITTLSLTALFYLIYSTAPDVKNSPYVNSLKNKAKINREESQKRKQLLKEIQGNVVDKTWLDKIQDNVSKSGLTNVIPKLTAENFIVVNLVIALAISVVTFMFIKNILISFVFGVIYLVIPFLAVRILSKRTFDKIDSILVTFEDTMAANANISRDLVEIFRLSEDAAQEPIRSYITLFLHEVDTGLTVDEALKNLIARSPSETFKNFITNLYISYKNTSNFEEVIKESNDVAIKAASNYEEQKQKMDTARKTTVFISLTIVGVILMTIKMLDLDLVQTLFFTKSGNWLFVEIVGITIVAFWYLVVADNLRKR